MFSYTLDNKRYHTLNYFFRNKFGCKIFKVALNAGFSCPNYKTGGCIFCNHGSGNYYEKIDLKKQFDLVKIPLEKNGLILNILLIFKLIVILMHQLKY